MEKIGKIPFNAECSIDYKKKRINFKYLTKTTDKKVLLGYFVTSPLMLLGMFVGTLLFVLWFKYICLEWVKVLLYFHNPLLVSLLVWIILLSFFIHFYIFYWGSIAFFGYINIFLFTRSKKLRKLYPKINAFLKYVIKRKIKIDLSRKLGKYWIIENNKVFVLKYSVMRADYELIGDCAKSIRKVYTKFYGNDKEKENIMTSKFYLIFEFSRPPKGEIKVIV